MPHGKCKHAKNARASKTPDPHPFVGHMDRDCDECGYSIYMGWHTDGTAEGLRAARIRAGFPVIGGTTK